jgi:three-Cys-motif partner protein
VTEAYTGREQTQAKHFILRRYLQELAFKVLHWWDLTYVDGFSGPWESHTDDLSDTSFMIAIAVLKDAQEKVREQTGQRRRIRCFFSEKNAEAYEKLCAAVAPHNKPDEGFEIRTYLGKFEDAVSDIESFVGTSFPLIFIDPTGWTGYPLITEGAVRFASHELVDGDEVDGAAGSIGKRLVGCSEGVIHGGQPLLAVQHDVFG